MCMYWKIKFCVTFYLSQSIVPLSFSRTVDKKLPTATLSFVINFFPTRSEETLGNFFLIRRKTPLSETARSGKRKYFDNKSRFWQEQRPVCDFRVGLVTF